MRFPISRMRFAHPDGILISTEAGGDFTVIAPLAGRSTPRYSNHSPEVSDYTETMMDVGDVELLRQVGAGSHSALATLYDRHASRVLGVIQRFVSQRADAEDVLQVTFIEVWNKACLFSSDRGVPIVWMLLIARSRAFDFLRKRREKLPKEKIDLVLIVDDSENADHDSADRLHKALETLPTEQSDVIRQSFFSGLTHEEIARQTQIPLGTVKTRIRLGIQRLAIILTRPEVEPVP